MKDIEPDLWINQEWQFCSIITTQLTAVVIEHEIVTGQGNYFPLIKARIRGTYREKFFECRLQASGKAAKDLLTEMKKGNTITFLAGRYEDGIHVLEPTYQVTCANQPGRRPRKYGNSLEFHIPKSNNITHVRITLDPTDTYTMVFMKMHRREVTNIAEHSGLFADDLKPVFTKETGLLNVPSQL